jgi:hypothetical protein
MSQLGHGDTQFGGSVINAMITQQGYQISFNEVFHLLGWITSGLSGPLEFASTFGWQGKHFSLQLRHISNAGLHEPNRGETMALAGLSF